MSISDTILKMRIKNYKIHRFFEIKEIKEWWKGDFLGHKSVVSPGDSNDYIKTVILSQKPFFIGRVGDVETKTLVYQDMINRGALKQMPSGQSYASKIQAGMFTNTPEGFQIMFQRYLEALKIVTDFGYWQIDGEKRLVRRWLNPRANLFNFSGLKSIIYNHPYTGALRGKTVLVVSPFAETIVKQYQKRTKLFANPETLPDFLLKVYKPVVTHGGGTCSFPNWETALLGMYSEIRKIDCDLVILSCGSYGLPLGGLLFKSGKNVLVGGGPVQTFFGIKGKAYEKDPEISPLINEWWVRPSSREIPPSPEKVEGGVYW